MQLDPTRARRDAALGLRDRLFEGVQAAERDQPALAFAGPREHAVVGDAVGGVALGVVQREHARAPRAGVVELSQQLLERQRAPVLVEAEVGVRVQHLGVHREQLACFGEERSERIRVKGRVHGRHTIRSRGL